MADTRLIGGPYRPPRTRRGKVLYCEWRGDVIVAGTTDTEVPWPYSRGCRQRPLPILTGGLVEAIKTESVEAIKHHWGVSSTTVKRWREHLDVPRFNPGTLAVWRRLAPAKLTHARSCRTFTRRAPARPASAPAPVVTEAPRPKFMPRRPCIIVAHEVD